MDNGVQVKEKTVAEASVKAGPVAAQGVRGEVVVNVRFQPNGLVNMISNKPETLSSQEWFDRLCRVAANTYRPMSGGRGAFRLSGDDFQLIWDANA